MISEEDGKENRTERQSEEVFLRYPSNGELNEEPDSVI